MPGCCKTPEEAAYARDRAAIYFHGDMAVLNFPENKEKYTAELAAGINWQNKLYQNGKVTSPMKYISLHTGTDIWLVKNERNKVIHRTKDLEDAKKVRDEYFAKLIL